MAERVLRGDPHTTVKQELLVRYLDAWTPTVLRSYRRATYLEASRDGSVAAALRVFGEFADRIEGHQLDVVVLGSSAEPLADETDGLALRTVERVADLEVAGPVLAHLDLVGDGPLDEAAAWRLVPSLAKGKARELLITLPAVGAPQVAEYRVRLRQAGLTFVAAVELADDSGRTQLLVFATAVEKHLSAFKDALWSADEYAGIRYRDPGDAEHTPIDISFNPQLLPLRRALLEELATRGACPVADLQRYALTDTIYRPADAVRVLTALATAGAITREPEKGRLAPKTVVAPAEPRSSQDISRPRDR